MPPGERRTPATDAPAPGRGRHEPVGGCRHGTGNHERPHRYADRRPHRQAAPGARHARPHRRAGRRPARRHRGAHGTARAGADVMSAGEQVTLDTTDVLNIVETVETTTDNMQRAVGYLAEALATIERDHESRHPLSEALVLIGSRIRVT